MRLLALCWMITGAVLAEDWPLRYAGVGKLILTNLPSAPFPHPQRADGYSAQGKSFPAAEYYQDNTVAIFVPKGFKAAPRPDFVIHFHGWHNNVTNVLQRYELIDQFVESRRNAILVVPQGPRNAPDSFGGKLEETNGFKTFMTDVAAAVTDGQTNFGRIILSSHSGGYQVQASILSHGGLTKHVSEVWVFDGLYARVEQFATWIDRKQGRFVNLYTASGGTKRKSDDFIDTLKGKGASVLVATENAVAPHDLETNIVSFLFTELKHDQVLQGHRTFRELLQTSGLDQLGDNKMIIAPRRRDVPGQRISFPHGTLFIPDYFQVTTNKPLDVMLFFHGADWCAQQNFYDSRKNAVLLTITSTNYDSLFKTSDAFWNLVHRIPERAAGVSPAPFPQSIITNITLGKIGLASFSGGYAATRSILRQPGVAEKISDVILADSLYGPREKENSNQLEAAAMEPFLKFAQRAADGKCHFWFSHLFPPEEQHRGNTTTIAANYLIERVGAQREWTRERNNRGMQTLYRADKGNFHVLGYAGMITQDHFEHFYSISELFQKTSLGE